MFYLLDTNAVSYAVRQHPTVNKHLQAVPPHATVISSIVEAELLYGLAKKPQATRSASLVHNFLAHAEILVWDSHAAESYAKLQVFLSQNGKALSTMDALIAAHAHAFGATLVTADKAFLHLNDFVPVEDWTQH